MIKVREGQTETAEKQEGSSILLTLEANDTWDIYTFDADLKDRLRRFAARYPELCKLIAENMELGCVIYIVQKSRVSIHLNSPQSEARFKVASENAKSNTNLMFGIEQDRFAKT